MFIKYIKILILIMIPACNFFVLSSANAERLYLSTENMHINTMDGLLTEGTYNLRTSVQNKFPANAYMFQAGYHGKLSCNCGNLATVQGARINGQDQWTFSSGTPLYFSKDESVDIMISFYARDGYGGGALKPGVWNLTDVYSGASFYTCSVNCRGSDILDMISIYFTGTVTITSSTCSMISNNLIDLTWPSLSISEIANGSAMEKNAPISVTCHGSANIAPMDVTVTSSNGASDANAGIVNTSSANLGLKLTWAGDNSPVLLNQTISVAAPQAEVIKDLSIIAKPVKTGAGSIPAGNFSSTVTVAIQYH